MKKTKICAFAAALSGLAILCAPTVPAAAKGKILSPPELYENTFRYNNILEILQEQYVDTLDMNEVVTNGLEAMLSYLDPYTEYYNNDNIEELTTVASGNYGGIGSAIQARDSLVELSSPYHGKPAALAGVRHGDILLEIDGEPIPKTGIDISAVSKRLRGNPGTHVRLKVRRPWLTGGTDSILYFDIERQKVSIDAVPVSTVFDDGVAYIEVSTFNRNTAEDIRSTLADIKAKQGKNLKGVIIDLRDNGGGLLESAVSLLSIFMNPGTSVVETRYRTGDVENHKTLKKPLDTDIPLVVLVNGNTASASEIVSGAIQDLDRGVIMGRRTYGKGLVQTSREVGFDGVLKFTIGKYYLPSGRLVQALDYRDADGRPTLIPDSLTHEYSTAGGRKVRDGRGISPDVELKARRNSQLAWQLYNDRWISDFANRYRNTNPEPPATDGPLVTDKLYDEFKAFVDSTKLQYGKASKVGIEYIREAVEIEGLQNDSVTAAITALENLLKHDLNHELDANRPELGELLETEILERYYAPEEIKLRIIGTDTDILEARKLLLDPERYSALLKSATN